MRFLLDTHTLIWLIEDDVRLSSRSRQAPAMRSTSVYVSVASIWEMSIKISRGKLGLDRSLADLIDEELSSNGIDLLPIRREPLLRIASLPYPTNGHADPFDRMLVVQTLTEGLELLSADAKLDAYGVKRVW